jgi:hypothetical protein
VSCIFRKFIRGAEWRIGSIRVTLGTERPSRIDCHDPGHFRKFQVRIVFVRVERLVEPLVSLGACI